MNLHEAKRYAHKLIAEVIENMPLEKMHGDDAGKVMRALNHIRETHARMGPRTGDKPPRKPEYKGEKLSFDEPSDPGEHICRCNDRLPHAPGAIGPNGEQCSIVTVS
jgi:hypothetical protein